MSRTLEELKSLVETGKAVDVTDYDGPVLDGIELSEGQFRIIDAIWDDHGFCDFMLLETHSAHKLYAITEWNCHSIRYFCRDCWEEIAP